MFTTRMSGWVRESADQSDSADQSGQMCGCKEGQFEEVYTAESANIRSRYLY